MKTVYLVRHAKAVRRDQPIADFQRALRKRGKVDAQQMAQVVRDYGPLPQVILSSPATRALATARLCATVLDYPQDQIVTVETLYTRSEADAEEVLLPVLHSLAALHETVLLCGHDPLCTAAAHLLDRSFTASLPTGAVVCFACDVDAWNAIAPGQGKVQFYHFPKQAEPVWVATEACGMRLEQHLARLIATWHPEVARHMAPMLQRVGATVAQEYLRTRRAMHQEDGSGTRR